MLIACQRPEATFVAGFRRWKELGRQVKKGERGIGILAPLLYRKTDDGQDVGEENQDRRVLRGFKVVHVFDVTQTEAEDLPRFPQITGEPGEKTGRLEALIRSRGIELEYAPIPRGAGMSEGGKITVLPDLEPAERVAVLAHELVHELLHRTERGAEVAKTIRETEAEAVAFAVCRAAGLETGTRSSDYIQLHSRPGCVGSWPQRDRRARLVRGLSQ